MKRALFDTVTVLPFASGNVVDRTGSYGPAVLSAVSTLMVAVWDASTVTASTALS